jgi:predicted secreted hydrolase
MEYNKIEFPKDEQSHDNIVEWWYFNGNLRSKSGNHYAFMDCLFKVDADKVKIPFLKVPFKTAYFSHSLLSDMRNSEYHSEVNPISIVSTDSFSKQLLFINYFNPSLRGYTNYVIEKIDDFKYYIKTRDLELYMTSMKKPLLEGGTGFIDLNSDQTYYYSLTNLQTEGRIRIRDKWIDVTGKSWMDHQWADVSYSNSKWTWFSMQLHNDMEIVCFEYDNGKSKTCLAGISYPDDNHEHFNEVEIRPLQKFWKSSKTGTSYPLSWEIDIPDGKVSLKAEALIDNQEVNFGVINYWEGPMRISGTVDGDEVAGEGFMELVGYPSNFTKVTFLKHEVASILRKTLSYAKKEVLLRVLYLNAKEDM